MMAEMPNKKVVHRHLAYGFGVSVHNDKHCPILGRNTRAAAPPAYSPYLSLWALLSS